MKLIIRLFWFLTITVWLAACQITPTVEFTPGLEPSSDANTPTITLTLVPTETSVPSPVPTITPIPPSATPEPPIGTLTQISLDNVDLFEGASSWRVSGMEHLGRPLGWPKYSQDGSRLALVSPGGVIIYDAESLDPLTVLEIDGMPYMVDWSADGALLAVYHGDDILSLWEPASDTRLSSFWIGYPSIYDNLALSPDGKRIAALTNDGNKDSIIRDSTTGDILLELEADRYSYCPIFAFSPDGELLAGGCTGGEDVIWETVTGTQVLTLNKKVPHASDGVIGSWTTALAWSYQGDKIAFAMVKGRISIMVYDTSTGQVLADISTTDSSEIIRMAWLPDGEHIVSFSYDNIIRIWDIETLEEIKVIGDLGSLEEIALSPDGEHLIVIRADGILIQIDMAALLGE